MKFFDANVFLTAMLAEGAVAASARRLLDGLSPARPGCTSVLALDEVFWTLRKRRGAAGALVASRILLERPGLRVLAVKPEDWASALDLMEAHRGLKPRDAMHAAVALAAGASAIVSSDADFDAIPGLRREALI